MSRSRNSATDTKDTSTTPQIKSNSELGLPNEDEFYNDGLQRWHQIRRDWIHGEGKYDYRSSDIPIRPNGPEDPKNIPRNKVLDQEDIINRIFSSSESRTTLAEPVSLNDMVNILIEVWESDGLYD